MKFSSEAIPIIADIGISIFIAEIFEAAFPVAEGHPHPPLCVFKRWLCESKNNSLESVMWRGALGQGRC